MNNISEEQKEKIWQEISRAILDQNEIRKGEKTVKEFASDVGVTEDKARKILKRLRRLGIIDSRTIVANGGRPDVYFPIKDVTFAEIIKELMAR